MSLHIAQPVEKIWKIRIISEWIDHEKYGPRIHTWWISIVDAEIELNSRRGICPDISWITMLE